jgi:hypothetical protein
MLLNSWGGFFFENLPKECFCEIDIPSLNHQVVRLSLKVEDPFSGQIQLNTCSQIIYHLYLLLL